MRRYERQSSEVLLVAQDVVPESAAGKKHVLEIVVNSLRWRVAIGSRLVHHHLAFAVELRSRKFGVQHQVGNQFGGSRQVLVRSNRIHHGALFGGVGVEFAAHAFHAVDYVPCAAMGSAFEYCMFNEMSHSVLAGSIVAAAHIHGNTAAGHAAPSGHMHHTQPIWQRGSKHFGFSHISQKESKINKLLFSWRDASLLHLGNHCLSHYPVERGVEVD